MQLYVHHRMNTVLCFERQFWISWSVMWLRAFVRALRSFVLVKVCTLCCTYSEKHTRMNTHTHTHSHIFFFLAKINASLSHKYKSNIFPGKAAKLWWHCRKLRTTKTDICGLFCSETLNLNMMSMWMGYIFHSYLLISSTLFHHDPSINAVDVFFFKILTQGCLLSLRLLSNYLFVMQPCRFAAWPEM